MSALLKKIENAATERFQLVCLEVKEKKKARKSFCSKDYRFPMFDNLKLEQLTEAWPSDCRLEELSLRVGDLNPSGRGMIAIGNILSTKAMAPRLRVVKLSAADNAGRLVSGAHLSQLTNFFCRKIAHSDTIERLDLFAMDLGAVELCRYLKSTQALKMCCLAKWEDAGCAERLEEAWKKNDSVVRLCLDTLSAELFTALLESKREPGLSFLHVSDPKRILSHKLLARCLEKNNIGHVSVCHNHTLVGGDLPSQVGTLTLRKSRLDRASVGLIARQSPVLYLDLSNNNLDNHLLRQLAHQVSRNSELRMLNLSHNDLDGVDAGQSLGSLLARLPALLRLRLDYNRLGPDGAAEMAGSLHRVPKLALLSVAGCAIGDEGFAALCQTMTQHYSSVSTLIASDNAITGCGVVSVQTMLLMPGKKITLNLNANPIGDVGADAVAKVVASPAVDSLKGVCLESCGIGERGFSGLLDAVRKSSGVVFSQLRLDWPSSSSHDLRPQFVSTLKDNQSISELCVNKSPFDAREKDEIAFYTSRNFVRPLFGRVAAEEWPLILHSLLSRTGDLEGTPALSAVYLCLREHLASELLSRGRSKPAHQNRRCSSSATQRPGEGKRRRSRSTQKFQRGAKKAKRGYC